MACAFWSSVNTRGGNTWSDSQLYVLLAVRLCLAAAARPVSNEMCVPSPVSPSVYRAFNRSALPQSSAAIRDVNSSLVARNIFVRKH